MNINDIVTADKSNMSEELMLEEAKLALKDDLSPEVLWTTKELRRVIGNLLKLVNSPRDSAALFGININDEVRVKLTDKGREIHKQDHFDLYRTASTRPEYHPPKEDADGYSTWQLWVLMLHFGASMSLGCELPFETEVVLTKKPEKRELPKHQYEIFDRLREFIPIPDHCIRFALRMDAHDPPILDAQFYAYPFRKSPDGGRLYIITEQYTWIKTGSKGGYKDE